MCEIYKPRVFELNIEYSPDWVNNRVDDVGNTNWYKWMHKRGREFIKGSVDYAKFADSCNRVKLYSTRLNDLLY